MKALVRVVIALFACWAAAIGSLASETSSASVEAHTPLYFKKVTFNTDGATEKTYSEFLQAIRASVVSQGDERHDIPVLRAGPGTYLLVELSNAEGVSITIALQVTNLYLDAYRVGDQAYFFSNTQATAEGLVFNDTTGGVCFSYENNYNDLERVMGASRSTVDMGIFELSQAISSLHRTDSSRPASVARSLLVVIQMVSEAARFRYIETLVQRSIATLVPFRPNPPMLSLENRWGRLSREIQNSNEGGAFANSVELLNSQGDSVFVDNVDIIRPIIALMLFVCGGRRTSSYQLLPSSSDDGQYCTTRMMMAETTRPAVGADDNNKCTPSSPKVKIVGPNGLCVDIRNGNYNEGNPIQVYPCRTSGDFMQLWVLESDGTIRSNGKCLTAYDYRPGSYIMIYRCPTPVSWATIWKVRDDGTIMNPRSGLVLTATSRKIQTTLTLETNDYATSQGWVATNVLEPRVTSIMGFEGLCLHASGSAVWVEKCVAGKAEQRWALYGDGSIRPDKNRDGCLTCSQLKASAVITVSSCGPASSAQRWVFMRVGTIMNLVSGLVMDVRRSNPSLKQIILYPRTGNANQQWLPLL